MEFANVVTQKNNEEKNTQTAESAMQQLRDLQLSLVGGGMGDVLQ